MKGKNTCLKIFSHKWKSEKQIYTKYKFDLALLQKLISIAFLISACGGTANHTKEIIGTPGLAGLRAPSNSVFRTIKRRGSLYYLSNQSQKPDSDYVYE